MEEEGCSGKLSGQSKVLLHGFIDTSLLSMMVCSVFWNSESFMGTHSII